MLTADEAGVVVAQCAFFDERLHTPQGHTLNQMVGTTVEQYIIYWDFRDRTRAERTTMAFDIREAVLASMKRSVHAAGV